MCVANRPKTSQSKPQPCPWLTGLPCGQESRVTARLRRASPAGAPPPGLEGPRRRWRARAGVQPVRAEGVGTSSWTEARFRERGVAREPAGTCVAFSVISASHMASLPLQPVQMRVVRDTDACFLWREMSGSLLKRSACCGRSCCGHFGVMQVAMCAGRGQPWGPATGSMQPAPRPHTVGWRPKQVLWGTRGSVQ